MPNSNHGIDIGWTINNDDKISTKIKQNKSIVTIRWSNFSYLILFFFCLIRRNSFYLLRLFWPLPMQTSLIYRQPTHLRVINIQNLRFRSRHRNQRQAAMSKLLEFHFTIFRWWFTSIWMHCILLLLLLDTQNRKSHSMKDMCK